MYLYCNVINDMDEVCMYIAIPLMLWTRYVFILQCH